MLRCKARKNRAARHIFTYIERCGVKRNTADHGALQCMSVFQQPHQSLKIAPVEAEVTIFAYLAR